MVDQKRIVIVRSSVVLTPEQRKQLADAAKNAIDSDVDCIVGDPEIEVQVSGYSVSFEEHFGKLRRNLTVAFNRMDEGGEAARILCLLKEFLKRKKAEGAEHE